MSTEKRPGMWEARYAAEPGYLFGTEPARFLTENPWVHDGCASALLVADGEGRNGVHLARRGLGVTSFDLSPTAVARAQALAAAAGVAVDARVSTWQDWDWSRPFDLVVAIFIQFADPAFRARQFADLARAVRPGGRLALHGYTPEQVGFGTGGPPDPAHMYTEALLRDAFAAGWRIERLAAYEREVQEGRGHRGRSALIDLVARRV
jgi:SAM-dependent methyltransferase